MTTSSLPLLSGADVDTAAGGEAGVSRPRPPTVPWSTQLTEFFAVGGATLLAFPLAYLYRSYLGTQDAVYQFSFIAMYAAYVINDPHFAVTYVLYYGRWRARLWGTENTPPFRGLQLLRYLNAGVVVPALLLGWIITAFVMRSTMPLAYLIQLMYLTVGWHYVKQGFGVLSVLSARRKIRFQGWERQAIRAHCFSGWIYGWSLPLRNGGQMETDGISYQAYALGPTFVAVARLTFFATFLVMLSFLGLKWWREGRLPFVPLLGLLISIWLWIVFSGLDPVVAYAIPALHSIQYLYFVTLLKRGEWLSESETLAAPRIRALRLALFLATTLALGYLLFHGPQHADSLLATKAWGLGPTPLVAAVAAFVNIHHYFMDNVIWRRENPDTRHLTRA